MEKDNNYEVLAIRLKTEDKIAIMQFAEKYRLGMSTWARQVLMEKIEEGRKKNAD